MAAGGERSRVVGSSGESLALEHLCRSGLSLLERNFRCRGGEIDLVMQEGDTLVFVEVRQRRSARNGSAAESVTRAKLLRLLHTAEVYLARHPQRRGRAVRFDLVTLDGQPPSLAWERAAIRND